MDAQTMDLGEIRPTGQCAVAGTAGCCSATVSSLFTYLSLTIPVRPTVSKSSRPISAGFSGLVYYTTAAVDDQTKLSFSIPQRTLPWKPFFSASARRSLDAGG